MPTSAAALVRLREVLFKADYRFSVFRLKANGAAPWFRWPEVISMMLSSGSKWPSERLVQPKADDPSLFETPFGEIYYSPKGRKLLALLALDMLRGVYEKGAVRVSPGDVVFDLGAHVGTFTRYALSRGAAKVIAFEANPVHIALLEKTFATEVEQGRVCIVAAAAWREKTTVRFERHGVASKVVEREGVEVCATTVDQVVDELHLERVDFIKADIEGAERHALAGAERTIRRFHPKLAFCIYHLADDPAVIKRLIQSFGPYVVATNMGSSQAFAHAVDRS